MLIFILILVAILCAGMKASGKNTFYADYLSPKNTTTINAIFSVLIFLSHSVQYVTMNGPLDTPYFQLRAFLSQTVVVTYLFFSGYGIMESIKKKGVVYVKGMPFNRFFKLWYQFALMILMFLAVNLYIHREFTAFEAIFAFTGYTSIANSNWYMFVTFLMYIFIIVSFLIGGKRKWIGLALTSLFTVGYVALMIRTEHLELRYYDTILCFPLGMIYSMLKPRIDRLLMKNDVVWGCAFTALIVLFMYFSENRTETVYHRLTFLAIAPVLVSFFMMKVQISSTILDWFGRHIFSFFMLQRIPMLILKYHGYSKDPMFFIVASFFATVLISTVFDACIERLDRLIFRKKKTA